ncbi:Lrp/AsnC family transcriptional regulator [Salipiger mucosus]|uniref:Transcriptional regulator, AsnC family n=1 Tax=Salipiger mucosus DSM 16094 TaxID=1123237 RepID=S9SG08_9RHOB|nr:Lrp/AsnC family transcriptional regulator [Salipiger mucosus]EPX85219.1 Transcriptional regulator, AsnC family [Salipiger mucosus DSM 16094]
MKPDATDLRILEALQDNGRMTIAELSERVGLSPSPAHRRQKLLEEAGVIDRYVAVVNPAKVGLPMQAYIFLSLDHHSEQFLSGIEADLMRCPQVLECILLAGEDDFMIHVICEGLEDFENFLKTRVRNIEGVTRIRTSFRLRSLGNGRRVRFS